MGRGCPSDTDRCRECRNPYISSGKDSSSFPCLSPSFFHLLLLPFPQCFLPQGQQMGFWVCLTWQLNPKTANDNYISLSLFVVNLTILRKKQNWLPYLVVQSLQTCHLHSSLHPHSSRNRPPRLPQHTSLLLQPHFCSRPLLSCLWLCPES